MSRGKYTAAEKRQASLRMKKYWGKKKAATRTVKGNKPSKAAIRQFTKAVQGLFSA
jgi:hypothetical protein